MKVTSVLLAGIIVLGTATLPIQAEVNIVSSVVKAPVTADGDVVSAATDLVIDLDTSLDPTVPGRTLLAGRTIKVTLPDEFVNTGRLPFQDVFRYLFSAICRLLWPKAQYVVVSLAH